MITEAILGIVVLALSSVLALLPDFDVPDIPMGDPGGWEGRAYEFGGLTSKIESYVPLELAVFCIQLLVGVFVAVTLIRFLLWLYKILPFKFS